MYIEKAESLKINTPPIAKTIKNKKHRVARKIIKINPFPLFIIDEYARVKAQHPLLKNKEVFAELAIKWKGLPEDVKSVRIFFICLP